MDKPASRREFLRRVTTLGAVALPVAGSAAHEAHGTAARHATGTAGSPADTDVYLFFTAPEQAFIEAAVARLIPADELGPGAREAGVPCFIDRQLAGAWGADARTYRQGPWPEGTPEQGHQSRLTPRETYRAAIADIDRYCVARLGGPFAELAPAGQDAVLGELERGAVDIPDGPGPAFFELLWTNTREGFFCDPIHGGNRDKVGWRLVGFPGVAAAYIDLIEVHDTPYRVEPVSIADLERHSVPVDAHGHPIHAPLRKRT